MEMLQRYSGQSQEEIGGYLGGRDEHVGEVDE